MKTIIETKRLILREFSVLDAESLFDLNADPEVLRHTGDEAFSSVADAALFLSNYSDYQKNGFGRWAVMSKETNDFLGWCGLKLNEENRIDIGFRFIRNEWDKGFATESARACLEYGFNHLNMIEIIGRVSDDNKASINVLVKLGMNFWKAENCIGIENAVYYRVNKTQYNKAFSVS